MTPPKRTFFSFSPRSKRFQLQPKVPRPVLSCWWFTDGWLAVISSSTRQLLITINSRIIPSVEGATLIQSFSNSSICEYPLTQRDQKPTNCCSCEKTLLNLGFHVSGLGSVDFLGHELKLNPFPNSFSLLSAKGLVHVPVCLQEICVLLVMSCSFPTHAGIPAAMEFTLREDTLLCLSITSPLDNCCWMLYVFVWFRVLSTPEIEGII